MSRPPKAPPKPLLPTIRAGMRVRIDYTHPEAKRVYRMQRHTGRLGTVTRENHLGRPLPGHPETGMPGGMWYVKLDPLGSKEGIEIVLAGAALMPVEGDGRG